MADGGLQPDAFCCCVCRELLREPASVPCGHSFCLSCVRAHWDREEREEGGGSYSCPQCRRSFARRPALAVNSMLAVLMEALWAQRRAASPAPSVCGAKADGQKVKALSVASTVAERRERLEQSKEQLRERIQRKERTLSALEQRKKDIVLSADAAEKHGERCLEELIQMLKDRLNGVNQQVMALKEEDECKVQGVLDRVVQDIAALSRERRRLDQLCLAQDVQFLREFTPPSEIEDEIDSDAVNKAASSDRPSLHRVVEDAVEELRENLEMDFNEYRDGLAKVMGHYDEMKERKTFIDDNNITHVFAPDFPDPMPRDELLQYARDVTFNPNTAHGYIVLSAENRKAKMVARKRNYRKHSERFMRWTQVLGKEPLTGRCYIEVKMRMKDMLLVGLSYKDIERKSKLPKCCFAANKISWALNCLKSGPFYFEHNNEVTTVWWSGSDPDRLGIFLDHDAGIVKYYRLDEPALLHEIRTTFTRPLYLAVALGDPGDFVEVCKLK